MKEVEGRRIITVRATARYGRLDEPELVGMKDFNGNINLRKPIEGVDVAGKDEAVISQDVMHISGFHPGDVIEIELPDGSSHILNVAGLVSDQTTSKPDPAANNLMFVTIKTLQSLGLDGTFNQLYVTVNGDGGNSEFIASVAAQFRTKWRTAGGQSTAWINTFPPNIRCPTSRDNHWRTGGAGRVDHHFEQFADHQYTQCPVRPTVAPDRRDETGRRAQPANFGDVPGPGHFLRRDCAGHCGSAGRNGGLWAGLVYGLFDGRRASGLSHYSGGGHCPDVDRHPYSAGRGLFPGQQRRQNQRAGSHQQLPPRPATAANNQSRFSRWVSWISRPILLSFRNTFRKRGRLLLTIFTLTIAGAVFIAVFNVRDSVGSVMENLLQHFTGDVTVNFSQPYRVEKIQKTLLEIPGVKGVEGWTGAAGEIWDENDNFVSNLSIIAPPQDSQLLHLKLVAGRWLLPDEKHAIVVSDSLYLIYPDLKPGDQLIIKLPGQQQRILDSGGRLPLFVAVWRPHGVCQL